MRWAWDESADARVVGLWHLREELARSRRAVYGKWYQGRAVFFSRPLFVAMLAELAPWSLPLEHEARELLRSLEDDSPISSKALRSLAGLRGKMFERTWTKAMNVLWERLLAVGTGAVDDGAFPSLEVGATSTIFEPLWDEAKRGVDDDQRALLAARLPKSSSFGRHWHKLLARARAPLPEFYPGDIDDSILPG